MADPRINEEEEVLCPVCLISSHNHHTNGDGTPLPVPVFCRAPCSHVLCQPCSERLIDNPRGGGYTTEEGDNVPQLGTVGRCPVCRRLMDLLDLRRLDNDERVYENNRDVSQWPIYGASFQQRLPNDNNNNTRFSILDGEGMTFTFSDEPYVEFRYGLFQQVQEGETLLQSVAFNTYQFTDAFMVFRGSVVFDSPVILGGNKFHGTMDCMLQFSQDGSFVRDGYIRWTPSPSLFPLDGEWRVTWESGDSALLKLACHGWSLFGIPYQIKIGGEDEQYRPHFTWPFGSVLGELVRQTATLSVPPGSEGPEIGENIVWTTTDPEYSKITWTRLSKTGGGRTSILSSRGRRTAPYRRVDASTRSVPSYRPDSIWGNTFCQDLRVGLASYHFEPAHINTNNNSDENEGGNSDEIQETGGTAYISYEHPHTSIWPPLDNGSPIPSRVPFRNIEWDPTSKTFRGDICWMEDYGTTWEGCRKWSYVMEFDPSLTYIKSGTVTEHREENPQFPPHSSISFGVHLVYINAAVQEYFRHVGPNQWDEMRLLWNSRAPEYVRDELMAVFDGSATIDMNL